MCAPLHDDKGAVRYFIGAQVDITGLVEEGLGIESFRALLQKDRSQDFEKNLAAKGRSGKDSCSNSWQSKKTKEALLTLQELSLMFSQKESDVVNRNSRSSDNDETRSISSTGTQSVKNRGQTKRFISSDEPIATGSALSHLTIGNQVNASLPAVYKHVS